MTGCIMPSQVSFPVILVFGIANRSDKNLERVSAWRVVTHHFTLLL